MDQSQKTSLLLEMNLRFLSANLQINSLILNSLDNKKALAESQIIFKNMLSWLRTLNQYVELPDSTKVLVDSLLESVNKSHNHNLIFELENTSFDEKPINLEEDLKVSNPTDTVLGENLNFETNNDSVSNLVNNETVNSFLYRKKSFNDRWDYISTINSFMATYAQMMHVLIPNLIFELVKELHRYDSSNKIILHDSVTHPTLAFQNLITKLLREAPGSNLFRRIRRTKQDNQIDLTRDQEVTGLEQQKIKTLIELYFNTLEKYLDPSNPAPASVDTLFEKTNGNFNQFSLGPLTIETRLTAVVKSVTETSFNEAKEIFSNNTASNSTKVIYLATTQLLCDFQILLLKEPRILKFLEDLKG